MNGQALVALAGVAGSAGVALVAWLVRRWWRSLRARWRARVAGRGEEAAKRLLRREGFAIEGAQVRRRWSLSCDGETIPVELRADYVVRRRGRRYVADVKTGPLASRITTAATRRQLLEYRIAYDVSGVLLVDMERGHIHEIGFDL